MRRVRQPLNRTMSGRSPRRRVLASEQAGEQGVLTLIGGHLLGRAPTALVLGDPGEHLIDVLATPSPARLLTPLTHHLTTHNGNIPQGVCPDELGGSSSRVGNSGRFFGRIRPNMGAIRPKKG